MIKKLQSNYGLIDEIRKIKKMESPSVHNCTFPLRIAEWNFLKVQNMYCENNEKSQKYYIYEFKPCGFQTKEEVKYIIDRILEISIFRPFQSIYSFNEKGNAVILFNSVSLDGQKFCDVELFNIEKMLDGKCAA